MDSQEAPDPDADGVAVRVLLPDGGQMEAPEEEGEDAEGEEQEADEGAAESTENEETDAEAAEEGASEESDQEASEGEGEEAQDEREEQASDEESDEEAEGEDAEEMGDEAAEEEESEDTEAEGEDEEEETEREKAVSDEGARILHLNLDGLFLDLLGLEVDLDTVTLDITAVTGESKLLGNLLSAVSGLLGGDPLSSLLPDNPLSGLFGGGEGEEGEEGEGSGLLPDVHPVQRAKELAASIADAIRGMVEDAGSSIISALPLEELLAEFLQAIVEQLLDTADDGDEAEAEEAAASA